MIPPVITPIAREQHLGEAGAGFPRPLLFPGEEGIRNIPLPGIRCQTCAAKGEEVWVIPGRACGSCGTPAPNEELGAEPAAL
ncbi:hypothetical protein QBC46DRAFT_346993 [Diplogelasinospora grovesii]|uniref:Uncharacterized protein n=1 Tax=Diplogelasinospora grovesii TaxID=303347 RepID=A0AAN6RZM0_9PEZI|nr:hypothetical protein QBC46DRAFT_346993 [Diplogelasinospora grovesii]